MATDRTSWLWVAAAAGLLLWPALWNGFPIVFADTGTYLSQAIHHYAGWDRPVFYSLFMLPLHATVTVWPVVVVQAWLTAWVLWLVVRTLAPGISATGFVLGVAALSAFTWLPWLVCELMPDLFTPLLILALCLLAVAPERLAPSVRIVLAGLATSMIACHQSNLPLACALGSVLLGWVRLTGSGAAWAKEPPGHRPSAQPNRALLIVLPPALAILGLCTVNLAAHGRFATAPFGNVFLLARVIYDGPGMAVLRRDCPASGWRLCAYLNEFPPNSDDFLWSADGPLHRAGGAKAVSHDANAIIEAALLADPRGEARAAFRNTVEQMTRFESGDGLSSWPAQVSPWIERDFPAAEQAAYAAARQQAGSLSVPTLLGRIHIVTCVGGVVACAMLLPVAFRRRSTCAGFLLAVLVVLPLSAGITGSLSGPHDRYQARIMWLAPFIAAVSLASFRPSPPARPGVGASRRGPENG